MKPAIEFAQTLTKLARLLDRMSPEDAAKMLELLAAKLPQSDPKSPQVDPISGPRNGATSGRNSLKSEASQGEIASISPSSSSSSTSSSSNYRADAREVLTFLNAKAGRTYRFIDTNLKLIEARLRSGATVADCKGVVARKCREWKHDAKMDKFLRPITLFSATNFEQYLGQKEPEFFDENRASFDAKTDAKIASKFDTKSSQN